MGRLTGIVPLRAAAAPSDADTGSCSAGADDKVSAWWTASHKVSNSNKTFSAKAAVLVKVKLVPSPGLRLRQPQPSLQKLTKRNGSTGLKETVLPYYSHHPLGAALSYLSLHRDRPTQACPHLYQAQLYNISIQARNSLALLFPP